MLTLALDTSSEIGSIALAHGDRLLEQARLEAPGGFGQTLFGELEALLTRQNVRLSDIDLYAAGKGPGSFTGVRIALAAVKGLAEVNGKPVIGVSNLAALAEFGSEELRAPVFDARRGEVFAALYDRAGREVIAPSVLPLADFTALVGDWQVEWITTGFDIGRAATAAPPELAGMMARLAIRRLRAGESGDAALIEADYVRRPDAVLFLK